MTKRFGSNKFNAKNGIDERAQNTREEKKVKGERPKLLFSFKDFDKNQCPPGQSFTDWQKNGLLDDLMEKMVDLSQKDRIEACQQKCLKIYGEFPDNTDFKIPRYIEGDVEWGVIEDVGGQLHRVAGYMIDNVFYIVFLDKGHKFYKMKNIKG